LTLSRRETQSGACLLMCKRTDSQSKLHLQKHVRICFKFANTSDQETLEELVVAGIARFCHSLIQKHADKLGVL
jgi:hypothetical protein